MLAEGEKIVSNITGISMKAKHRQLPGLKSGPVCP
jgi:hypothetical protein